MENNKKLADELDEHCDNCDFIRIINLKEEEKEKSEKAKQKLVACCKNSAEKIKNQREQLKACNKKIEELMADVVYHKKLIRQYSELLAHFAGVTLIAEKTVERLKEKVVYVSNDGNKVFIRESDFNDVINDVVGEMKGGCVG